MPSAPKGEFDLIGDYFAPLSAGEPGAYGLTDDAAVLALGEGQELVVSTDTLIDGVHFPHDTPPALVAHRVLAVNLSDLAAMGAAPRGYFLALSLPKPMGSNGLDTNWIAAFADGLRALQDAYQIVLMGGDTVATPGPLSVTITVMGSVTAGQAITRSGVRPGDKICVSGTIGDAALGLRVRQGGLAELDRGHRDHLMARFDQPTPRVALGQGLSGLAHAALDVSDGLVQDLGHMARASGVRLHVQGDAVPLSDAARQAVHGEQALFGTAVLGGGDDYELAFAVHPDRVDAALEAGRKAGVAVTVIGEAVAGEPGVSVFDGNGDPIQPPRTGYRHF